MSKKLLQGNGFTIPSLRYKMNGSAVNTTLNASGEAIQYVGQCWLENPEGGSKTISAAGGGSILWKAGTVTFANGGSVFKVGIQDVHTTNNPGQGDGTFDVYAQFTGGGGGISSAAYNTSVMTSGTKTIAHGDYIAIVIEFTTIAGADAAIVESIPVTYATNWPLTVTNTGGSFAKLAAYPLVAIKFDDGSVGYLYGAPAARISGNVTYNSATGTADEYGNLINVPFEFKADGIEVTMTAGSSADYELILYSDPLGTPVAERTISFLATRLGNTVTGLNRHLFSSPFIMKPNTDYAVALRPTTANNVAIYGYDTDATTGFGEVGPPHTNSYAVRRLDNTGAFSDYNGGTAKTRIMSIGVCGNWYDQGINKGNLHIGI